MAYQSALGHGASNREAQHHHHRPLESRPYEVPHQGLPPSQNFYEPPVDSYSSIHTGRQKEQYGAVPQYQTSGVYATPSPSDLVTTPAHAGQNQYYQQGINNEYTPTESAAFSDHGNSQYRAPSEEVMFRYDGEEDPTRPIAHGEDAYWLPTQAPAPAPILHRTPSIGSQSSNHATVLTPDSGCHHIPRSHNADHWNAIASTASGSGGTAAMPIHNQYGLLPNRLLTSQPGSHGSFGRIPSSYQSGDAGGSYESAHSYMTAASAASSGHANIPNTYPTGVPASSVPMMTTHANAYATHGQQYNSHEGHIAVPQQQRVATYQEFTPQAPVSSVYPAYEHSATTWQHQLQQVPSQQDWYSRGMDRDELLVYARDTLKLPYREIKLRYGLEGAESTLRGRYRALVKEADMRPRKPLWDAKEEQLLGEAVLRKIGRQAAIAIRTEEDLNRLGNRISWKDVSEYVFQRTGRFKFGTATCKKQYIKLYCKGGARSAAGTRQTSFSV